MKNILNFCQMCGDFVSFVCLVGSHEDFEDEVMEVVKMVVSLLWLLLWATISYPNAIAWATPEGINKAGFGK